MPPPALARGLKRAFPGKSSPKPAHFARIVGIGELAGGIVGENAPRLPP
jgi:hypothetical protein